MTRSKMLASLLGFLLTVSLPGASLHAAESLLVPLAPEDHAISGWLRDGEPMQAVDLDSLTMLINGAAPFYLEHGVIDVLFQDYINDADVFLTLEIYRTQTEEQAQDVYRGMIVENSETLESLGREARLLNDLIGAYVLEFWQKTFFVRLTIAEKSEHSKTTMTDFAEQVSSRMAQYNEKS
jgi:hypothetical protein